MKRRHKHSLSNYHLLTGDMGKLYPINCVEILPGDTIQQFSSALIRMQPMLAPVMHPVQVRIHHFFVPTRIIWDGWEDFITGGDGTAQPDIPVLNIASIPGGVGDYLGIPETSGHDVSALPFYAYNKIFNEYYRDQDLVNETTEQNQVIQHVAWGKDYFTTARPWPQKGPEITLPLGTQAPVKGIGSLQSNFTGTIENFNESDGETREYQNYLLAQDTNDSLGVEEDPDNPGYPNIYADLSSSEAIPINEFRRAFALQRYQEARARYGSRYTEYLAYCGVRSSDARLQRPEYLGGGKQTMAFSEVLQTAPDDTGATPSVVGELKGHGITALKSRRYRKFFEEHGYIMSLLSVRPKSIYADSIHRKFLRQTKEDYYQKELAQIGQQEIYNSEIYADPIDGMETFGYTDRYREYKEEPSIVTGEFRELLNYWHLAREFDAAPALNEDFVKCDPSKRIYAEQTQHSMWMMVNNSIQARRMVPRSSASRIL